MRYVGLGMRADRVVQFMWEAGLTELPVLDHARRPVGLVSLGDLLAAEEAAEGGSVRTPVLALLEATRPAAGGAAGSPRIEDIMVFGIATVHESLPLASAAARMLRSERECLVVVDDQGVAIGSLSMPDIMRWLVEQTVTDEAHAIRGEMVTPGIADRER
jgi:CBS-domain-containing membrane protein